MANTLNLGTNGNWATKKDSLLAYNSENGNFKPLPFDFDRASSATRVNKDGLIETVGSGEPRIDYKDDSKGALLLEPSRTNLITYSEDFTQWNNNGVNVTLNQGISTNGNNNANRLEGTLASQSFSITTTSVSNYTFSMYVKPVNSPFIRIIGGVSKCYFNMTNKTVATNTFDEAIIEDVGNGWFRLACSSSNTANTFETYAHLIDNTSTEFVGSDYLVWGAQLEQGSYATSYIPTSGSAVTRVAESCEQTPPSGIIGQTEGTMFYDGYYGFEPAEVYLFLQENLGNGVSDSIYIQKFGSNSIAVQVYDGNDFQTQLSGGSYVFGQRIKIAFAYKQNDFAFYINNVQIGVSSGGLIPTLNSVQIGTYPALADTNNYIASNGTNEVKLYNTRLSNAELQALTTI